MGHPGIRLNYARIIGSWPCPRASIKPNRWQPRTVSLSLRPLS
ncbi:hypothetical protein BRPE64_ACDS20340 [Caballeronia insecticola]|uniref:Uncharacterized protein n=1 Tax=Caballeronia insecticola TaxID=758793 RepID=R4WHT0_9BURK|nr:hypothetical protein BRPE64_ACDS20340 [Caballeronia insecticola]